MTTAEIISELVSEPPKRVVRSIMPSVIEAATNACDFDNLDFKLSMLPSVLKPHDLIIVAAGHKSHADLAVVLKFASSIRRAANWIGNFHLPLAASVEGGQQGPVIQWLFVEGGKPAMLENKVYPLNVTTDNDISKRGLKPKRRETLEKLSEIIHEENSAIFVFPEATLDGGRFDQKKNGIYGLRRVTKPVIGTMVRMAKEAGRGIVTLAVGISGTNHILSPESKLPTPEFVGAFVEQQQGKYRFLARVKVGRPVRLEYERGINFDELMMRRIAKLLPPDERGDYSHA